MPRKRGCCTQLLSLKPSQQASASIALVHSILPTAIFSLRASSATRTPRMARNICLPNQTPPVPGTASSLKRRTARPISKVRVRLSPVSTAGPNKPHCIVVFPVFDSTRRCTWAPGNSDQIRRRAGAPMPRTMRSAPRGRRPAETASVPVPVRPILTPPHAHRPEAGLHASEPDARRRRPPAGRPCDQ